MRRLFAPCAVLGLVASCGSGGTAPPPDAMRQRRVIDRPAGLVHALPPFAIRDDSVGPYRLGEPLSTVLAGLPSGPRGVAVLDLPGMVRLSVIRAEDDKLLIGGEPMATATFIAVLAPDVARTGAGLAVGSTERELRHSLGDPLSPAPRVVDPRLLSFARSPGATYFVQDDKVFAVLLEPARAPSAAGSGSDAPAPTAGAGCAPLAPLGNDGRARVQVPAAARVFSACFGPEPEHVALVGDQVVLVHAGGERRSGAIDVPGLRMAGVLPTEGKDELVVVRHELDKDRRRWLVAMWRQDAGRLFKVAEDLVYEISASNADWIGARLLELDLALTVEASADTLKVGGYLIDRQPQRVRNIVPLTPVTIARRRRGPLAPEQGAGSGAGSGAAQAGSGSDEHGATGSGSGRGDGAGSHTPHTGRTRDERPD